MNGKRIIMGQRVYEVTVGLDEKEEIQLNLSHQDAGGREVACVPFSMKAAKAAAYAILNVCYRLENNLKVPEIGGEQND